MASCSPLASFPHHHLSTSLAPAKRPLPLLFSPKMSLASSSPNHRSDDSLHSAAHIRRMEPFNRSGPRSPRMLEPSVLEEAQRALSDRCMSLKGEEAYKCWEALFEFESMKEECKVQCDTAPSQERATACRPLERFENIVQQSESISSLISNIRILARNQKGQPVILPTTTGRLQHDEQKQEIGDDKRTQEERRRTFPEPGGLPPQMKS